MALANFQVSTDTPDLGGADVKTAARIALIGAIGALASTAAPNAHAGTYWVRHCVAGQTDVRAWHATPTIGPQPLTLSVLAPCLNEPFPSVSVSSFNQRSPVWLPTGTS